MDLTVNRIATEAYVSPIRPIKPVTSNAERAEIVDRLKEAVRAAPAAGDAEANFSDFLSEVRDL